MDRVVLQDNQVALAFLGQRNANLKRLEREARVQMHCRGNEITLVGGAAAVARGRALIEQLYEVVASGKRMGPSEISRAAQMLRDDKDVHVNDIMSDTVLVAARGKNIVPKGIAQKRYVDAIRKHDVVFGIGPAGTGKTYLAMALAVRALLDKKVARIVLTRPAVEAGERLGFLPGSLEEKVSPYLRPLYDALADMMDVEKAERLVDKGLIEIAPLAFMRGRTLNDAFVVLDEAQNTTGEQMKMFLTRLGFGSRAVITGDLTQVDLPDSKKSGLQQAMRVLDGVEGLTIARFSDVDVVRHPLVQRIVNAYDRFDAMNEKASGRRRQVPASTLESVEDAYNAYAEEADGGRIVDAYGTPGAPTDASVDDQ